MNTIITKVNGEGITRQVLEGAVARYIVQMEEDEESDFEPTDENMKYIKTEALNHLIERTLLLQKAVHEKIEIEHDAVRINIDRMKANFADESEWKDNLLALHIPEENLFEAVKNDMILEKLLNDRYMNRIRFTEKELREYYATNEKQMKEPDLFSFYEAFAKSPDQVKEAYQIFQNSSDLYQIENAIEKAEMEFHNHTDVPSYQMPDEVFQVLNDIEPGKIGTMQAPDCGFLVYQLNKKLIGKSLEYDSIKEQLAEYLVQNAKKDITDELVKMEMDKANIEYIDTSFLGK